MTEPNDRAKALLDRALHPGTPVEEARTSAMAFAKLVRKEGGYGPPREDDHAATSILQELLHNERLRTTTLAGELAALRRHADNQRMENDRLNRKVEEMQRASRSTAPGARFALVIDGQHFEIDSYDTASYESPGCYEPMRMHLSVSLHPNVAQAFQMAFQRHADGERFGNYASGFESRPGKPARAAAAGPVAYTAPKIDLNHLDAFLKAMSDIDFKPPRR